MAPNYNELIITSFWGRECVVLKTLTYGQSIDFPNVEEFFLRWQELQEKADNTLYLIETKTGRRF